MYSYKKFEDILKSDKRTDFIKNRNDFWNRIGKEELFDTFVRAYNSRKNDPYRNFKDHFDAIVLSKFINQATNKSIHHKTYIKLMSLFGKFVSVVEKTRNDLLEDLWESRKQEHHYALRWHTSEQLSLFDSMKEQLFNEEELRCFDEIITYGKQYTIWGVEYWHTNFDWDDDYSFQLQQEKNKLIDKLPQDFFSEHLDLIRTILTKRFWNKFNNEVKKQKIVTFLQYCFSFELSDTDWPTLQEYIQTMFQKIVLS